MPPPRPLWRCPRCDARFLVANSPHSCGKFKLDDLFVRAEPHVRAVFDRLADMVREAGDATLIPQKTRAVFMTRMRFINVQVRRSHLVVGFVMRKRPAHVRFWRVETFSPRSHVGYMRVYSMNELDADVRRWIRAAHEAGKFNLDND
jgi:uncharacterized protein DUF5655